MATTEAANRHITAICDILMGRVNVYKMREVHCVPIFDALHLLEQRPVGISFFRHASGTTRPFLVHTSFQTPEIFKAFQTYLTNLSSLQWKNLLDCATRLDEQFLLTYHHVDLSEGIEQPKFETYISNRAQILFKTLEDNKESSSVQSIKELIGFLKEKTISHPTQVQNHDSIFSLASPEEDRAFVDSLRSVLDTVYWPFYEPPNLLAESNSLHSPILGPLCWIRTANITRRRMGYYDYTVRLVLSNNQRNNLLMWVNKAKRNKSYVSNEAAMHLQSINYNGNILVEQIEASLDPNEWSILDLPFSSGYVHFSQRLECGTPSTFKGSQAQTERSRALQCVFQDLESGYSFFHMPVHVCGAPWLILSVITPKGRNDDENTWVINDQVYDCALNCVANGLRSFSEKQYLESVGRILCNSLRDSASLDYKVLNERLASLACYYPYFSVRVMKCSGDDKPELLLPNGHPVEIRLEDNQHFEQQIHLDLLKKDKVIEHLTVVAYRYMFTSSDLRKSETIYSRAGDASQRYYGIKDSFVDSCPREEIHRIMNGVISMVENNNGLWAIPTLNGLVGDSVALFESLQTLEQAAKRGIEVLLVGETGTGKDRAAKAFHDMCPRRDKMFWEIDSAAIVASLFEGELFGHKRGSFTGAYTNRKGRFEEADGATVFINEIGDLSFESQAKLRRFLQYRTFEKVGENKKTHVDVLLVLATNRDLRALCNEGAFREDLYYRLPALKISIPPLRKRREDIPSLVAYFLRTKEINENDIRYEFISEAALELLVAYPWLGNVRELEQCLESLIVPENEPVLRTTSFAKSEDIIAWIRSCGFRPSYRDDRRIELNQVYLLDNENKRNGQIAVTKVREKTPERLVSSNIVLSSEPPRDYQASFYDIVKHLKKINEQVKKNPCDKNVERARQIRKDFSKQAHEILLESVIYLLNKKPSMKPISMPASRVVESLGWINLKETLDAYGLSQSYSTSEINNHDEILLSIFFRETKVLWGSDPEGDPVPFLTNVALLRAIKEFRAFNNLFPLMGLTRDIYCWRAEKRNDLINKYIDSVHETLQPFLDDCIVS